MSSIKSIYIIVFMLFTIMILSFKISTNEDMINRFYYSIAKIEKNGTYIKDMKQEFANKQEIVKKVKQILNREKLISSPNTLDITNTNISIHLQNINSKQTNKIINKLLNTSLIFTSLDMKNVDFNQTVDIKIKL